jgi:hypothetical protein
MSDMLTLDIKELASRFLYNIVIFVVLSEIFQGSPMFLSNVCWALGFSVLLTVRDALDTEKKRFFNLVMFGGGIFLMLIAMFDPSNSRSLLWTEAILSIGLAYYFCKLLVEE